MENVQPEEQKTQEKDTRAWSLNSINWKLVMGKESHLALFQRGQQPQMGKSYKGVNFSSKTEKESLSPSRALPASPSFPPTFTPRILRFFQGRTLPITFFFHWNFPFSNGGPACIEGINPCLILKQRRVYIKDSIKCDEVTFTSDLLHQDVIILHLASLWANERKNDRKIELLQNKWKHLGLKSQPD